MATVIHMDRPLKVTEREGGGWNYHFTGDVEIITDEIIEVVDTPPNQPNVKIRRILPGQCHAHN